MLTSVIAAQTLVRCVASANLCVEVWHLETIKGPQVPYVLQSFEPPESVKDTVVSCDSSVGGFSEAHLDWEPFPSSSPETPQGYVRFHGSISSKLPGDRPGIVRTGWAAWRTKERGATVLGRSSWDVDPYKYLALRIKSDGRAYLVNVQTESLVPTDLHQHRLFARRPGEWETVFIKWTDFVRTNHGTPVEPQREMLTQRVRTFGVGLTDRVPGPFELCIESMWATARNEAEVQPEAGVRSPGAGFVVTNLKTRSGGKARWVDGEGDAGRGRT